MWRQVKLFEFLTLTRTLPALIKAPVIEFYNYYKTKHRSGVVGGREIVVDAHAINKVMHLPMSKIEIDNFKDDSVKVESHFKCSKKSKTHVADWKVAKANDPHMMEWTKLFNNQITLKLHPTYLTTKQLQAVVMIHKGLMFNWVEFVYGRIHEEFVLIKKVEKVASFLYGHYFFIIVQHCLKIPRKSNTNRKWPFCNWSLRLIFSNKQHLQLKS
jgi:hypothetical protein